MKHPHLAPGVLLSAAALLSAFAPAPALAESTYLRGHQDVTFREYSSLPPETQVNNPPSCGLDYTYFDLTRITAVRDLEHEDCFTVLKVVNPDRPAQPEYVLAVDRGGHGLDLAREAYTKLGGDDSGLLTAQWEPVDDSFGAHIWRKPRPSDDEPGNTRP
ncbi:hypothetical protein AB0N09_40765 [Streptomyces erythrochromogenes]|uniref:hypothetical protein n=1 Tax=Streptomyces erythrochromogenes TaxID=285574 RepID=UPI0034213BCD